METTETTAVEETKARREFIAGLRELADNLEAMPQLPLPNHDLDFTVILVSEHFGDEEREDLRSQMGAVARALPGQVEKGQPWEGALDVRQRFGPIVYRALASGVCERRKVGTKQVSKEVEVEPAKTRTVVEEVEIFETVCPPLLS